MSVYFTDDVKKSLSKLNTTYNSFDERDRLILSFPIFDIPMDFQKDILEAYDYYKSKPKEFDGSTGAKEQWSTIYEPAPMRHDRDYQLYGGTYKGRLYSDLKFLKIKKMYKTSSIWRNAQYFAVRWGGFYFQFKNWIKGNTLDVPLNKKILIPTNRSTIQSVIEWIGIILVIPLLIFFIGAIVMDFKHKASIGWKLSTKWITSTFKTYTKRIF